MVQVDSSKSIIYLERAEDCYKSINVLYTLYYQNGADKEKISPQDLQNHIIKHFDVIFMLYSIGVISLVNSLTIKFFGEKSKDHTDLKLYRKLKEQLKGLSSFDRIVFEINNIKNKSEYGDKHYAVNETFDLKKFKKFLEYVKEI